ncbi:hypothetical protein MANI_027142 [Metarhizium anisopliae]|nr:hypothetical protein MANI_027142 [Metarhizium anisopliae]
MQRVRSCYSWRPNARPGVCDHVVYIGDVTRPPRTLAPLPVVPSRPALPPSQNRLATVVPVVQVPYQANYVVLCEFGLGWAVVSPTGMHPGHKEENWASERL